MRVTSCFSLIVAILFCGSMFAQEPDIWKPLRFFEGEWKGQGEGKVEVSSGHQTFSFILGGSYLRVENRTVFEPQEGNPQGEVHEDQGFFSYDRTRKQFVLRQFHIEGFVNQYAMEPLSEDGKTFVFTSESI